MIIDWPVPNEPQGLCEFECMLARKGVRLISEAAAVERVQAVALEALERHGSSTFALRAMAAAAVQQFRCRRACQASGGYESRAE